MKLVAGIALVVVIALGASACGSSHGVSAKDARLGFPSNVPAPLVSFIRGAVKGSEGTVESVAVYGPASRSDLVKAAMGDGIGNAVPQGDGFYLVVLKGNFGGSSWSRPPGAPPPHGTVLTHVVTPGGHSTDTGLGDSVRPAVAHLHRFATITVS